MLSDQLEDDELESDELELDELELGDWLEEELDELEDED